MENRYDVFILGSGPGGEGAAMTCAKEGLKVAICDDFSWSEEVIRIEEPSPVKHYGMQARFY